MKKIHFSWWILIGLILLQLLFAFAERRSPSYEDELNQTETRW